MLGMLNVKLSKFIYYKEKKESWKIERENGDTNRVCVTIVEEIKPKSKHPIATRATDWSLCSPRKPLVVVSSQQLPQLTALVLAEGWPPRRPG